MLDGVNNQLILLYGESASGKDYYVKSMGLRQVVSHTTRAPRPGEVNGIDKHFDKISTYLLAKEQDAVEAETHIQGNMYWVTADDFVGKDIFMIDIRGILYLIENHKADFHQKFHVQYMDTPWKVRLWRIIKRDGFIKGIRRFWSDRQTFSNELKHKLAVELS